MNSFTLIGIGQLAKDPETHGTGDKRHTKFALIGNDFAGTGNDELTTAVFFVAFGSLAKAIAENARKGDQLIVQAQMRANNWTPEGGDTQYGYSHVLTGFRFGAPGRAKREERAARS